MILYVMAAGIAAITVCAAQTALHRPVISNEESA